MLGNRNISVCIPLPEAKSTAFGSSLDLKSYGIWCCSGGVAIYETTAFGTFIVRPVLLFHGTDIICEEPLATKGNVMLLWGCTHDTNVYECVLFSLFTVFSIYCFYPTLPYHHPGWSWLDLRAAVTVPPYHWLDTQLAANRSCAAKGGEKKGSVCWSVCLWVFCWFCFFKPQKRNTEPGRAWNCPVECPKLHLACVRKHEIKVCTRKIKSNIQQCLATELRFIFFSLQDSHKVMK